MRNASQLDWWQKELAKLLGGALLQDLCRENQLPVQGAVEELVARVRASLSTTGAKKPANLCTLAHIAYLLPSFRTVVFIMVPPPDRTHFSRQHEERGNQAFQCMAIAWRIGPVLPEKPSPNLRSALLLQPSHHQAVLRL